MGISAVEDTGPPLWCGATAALLEEFPPRILRRYASPSSRAAIAASARLAMASLR